MSAPCTTEAWKKRKQLPTVLRNRKKDLRYKLREKSEWIYHTAMSNLCYAPPSGPTKLHSLRDVLKPWKSLELWGVDDERQGNIFCECRKSTSRNWLATSDFILLPTWTTFVRFWRAWSQKTGLQRPDRNRAQLCAYKELHNATRRSMNMGLSRVDDGRGVLWGFQAHLRSAEAQTRSYEGMWFQLTADETR